MKFIILILILTTNKLQAQQIINQHAPHAWPEQRYIENTDATILDKRTQLMWKKCVEGATGFACSTEPTIHNWKDALDIANTSEYAGYSDWRLPNIKELITLAAYDHKRPAINIKVFPGIPVGQFWSSTPYANTPGYTWSVNFFIGSYAGNLRDGQYYVRLVRGGQ